MTEPTRDQVNNFTQENSIKILELLRDESSKITDTPSSQVSLGLITLTRTIAAIMVECRNDDILIEVIRQLSKNYKNMKGIRQDDA